MNLKSKAGITLVSLGLYLVLFTSFTVFVSIIMTNLNNNLFDKRGEAINYSNLNKLQNNIETSSNKSNNVTISSAADVIRYSNGDVYTYDEDKKLLLKNGGVLCMSVDSFSATITEMQSGKKLELNVTFNKYLNVLKRDIISYVEAN